jgi:hypothetical protein
MQSIKKKEDYTLLCVFCCESHVPSFDRILCNKAIRNKYQNHLKVRLSTHENFIEGNLEDSYDFVLLIFMYEVPQDELEAQQEHYLYYSQVPIVHFAMSKAVYNGNGYGQLRSFLKDHLEDKLIDTNPIVFDSATAAAAESLAQGFDQLIEAYETKKNTDVLQAFNQFDADGSGEIDKDELAQLSAQLGAPLDDEQLKTALVDLDLNKDGVIDFDEFCRWYFTGMKPYNGQTRSMLMVGGKTGSIFDALAREKLADIINSDRSLSKHRISLQFNDPAEAYVGQMSIHVCGPVADEMAQKASGFRELLGKDLKEELGTKYQNIYFEIKVAMKSTAYKPHLKVIEDLFHASDVMGKLSQFIHIRFFPMDKELICRVYISIPGEGPQIPDQIRHALRDIDQHFRAKAVLGVDAEEVLSSDKPLLEHLSKGFKVEYELVFLRNLKKALIEGVKDEGLQHVLKQMGPAFALSSNSSVDLTFDDFDEVREHPYANQMLVSLGQIIEGAFGKSIDEALKYRPDFARVDKKALDSHVRTSEYCKEKMQELNALTAIANLLREFAQDFRIQVEGNMWGFVALKYDFQGAGYGDMALLLFNVLTMKHTDKLAERVVSDFMDAKKEENAASYPGYVGQE